MPRKRKTYSLDEQTIEKLDAWAKAHDMSASAAVDDLVMRGTSQEATEGHETADTDTPGHSDAAGHIEDLRGQIAVLTAQLDEKDEQLRRRDEQIDGLMSLADHAQALHAADKRIDEATGDDQTPKRKGIRQRLGTWLLKGGRGEEDE